MFLPREDQKEKYLILGCIIHLFFCQKSKEAHPLNIFQNIIMKIDQLEGGISTFEVPGSKWNLLLPGTVPGSKTTVSARKFTFSARW